MYGAGVSLIHRTTGLSVDEIRDCISEEERQYPGVAQFHALVKSVALRRGNPGFPALQIVELPTGCRIGFEPRVAAAGLPPLKNYPIQSYGAEVVQFALAKTYRLLAANEHFNGHVFVTNFVHDSIWLDCHVGVAAEAIAAIKGIMETITHDIAANVVGVTFPVPLQISTQTGKNMFDVHPVKCSDNNSDN